MFDPELSFPSCPQAQSSVVFWESIWAADGDQFDTDGDDDPGGEDTGT